MKITIESTDKLVHVVIGNANVPARVWEGQNADGDPVVCLVTRIAPAIPIDQLTPEQLDRFGKQLLEVKAPTRAALEAFPARLVL